MISSSLSSVWKPPSSKTGRRARGNAPLRAFGLPSSHGAWRCLRRRASKARFSFPRAPEMGEWLGGRKKDQSMEELGCVFVLMLLGFVFWKGCAYGKVKAERDFREDPVYVDFQSSTKKAEVKIAAAKTEAEEQVENAKALVRQVERELVGKEEEVERMKSFAVPDEKQDTDSDISEAEKAKVMEDFISWAGGERSEEYGNALAEQQKAEKWKQAAQERLATLEKSWRNKFGLKPDDKQYRDFLSKSEEAKKRHDEVIGKLQNEFFKIETEKRIEEIRRVMDGQHGDGGIRAVAKRAKENAARFREDAEKALEQQ